MEKPTLCPCCQEKEDQYQEFRKQRDNADLLMKAKEKAYRLPEGERENIINILLNNEHSCPVIKNGIVPMAYDRTDFELAWTMIWIEPKFNCNLSNLDIDFFEFEESHRLHFLNNAHYFNYDVSKVGS